ncbi:LexA family transcriptional regulator [Pseudomonas sp. DSV-1]|uniref:LexA family transcriptional regulator n=1 Tax=Pseudomonas sp. DSV-1 TaxID=3112250 RepID=UPI002DB72A89|nr:XRE family transcriptional regulator [Pseudomonas sp. DSV-1]MEC4239122.1 XRE family transcriptional regulator [Pseudomonas sp. DSV-1]
MKKPTRTPLSAEQLADAKRLSDIYKARARASKARGDTPALTQTEVGELCGWNSPQSTVSQYMNGKVALNLDALVKLARVLDFEPSEVSPTLADGVRMHVSTSVARESDASTPLPGPADIDGDLDERYAFIPQYDAKAAAGLGSENAHVEIRSTLAFKRDWLRMKGVNPQSLIVIYAEGESMWPTINDRDVLLVDRSRVEPTSKHIYVLTSTDKGTIVKRLIQTAMGDWIIRSDNNDEEYPDRTLSRSEFNEHHILGRVIWRGGDL